MDELINFINEYYVWIIVVIVVLIMALIGYLIDSNVKYRKNKKNETIDDNVVNKGNNVTLTNVESTQNNSVLEPVAENTTSVTNINPVPSVESVTPVNVESTQTNSVLEPVVENTTPVVNINPVPSVESVTPVNVESTQTNSVVEPIVENTTPVMENNITSLDNNITSMNADVSLNSTDLSMNQNLQAETPSIHNDDVVKSVEEILSSNDNASNNNSTIGTSVQSESGITANVSSPKIEEISMDNKESSDENDIWKF